MHLFETTHEVTWLIESNNVLLQLRKMYKRDNDLFEPYLDDLRMFSTQVQSTFSQCAKEILSEYIQASESAEKARKWKVKLRQDIMDICSSFGQEEVQLKSPTSYVKARKAISLNLPHFKSDERRKLMDILLNVGLWDEVTQISQKKLQKLLQDGKLNKGVETALRDLCTEKVTFQLKVNPVRK